MTKKVFYYEPAIVRRCSMDSSKIAMFVVKSQGETYRGAHTETCAKRQIKELGEAWNRYDTSM